MEPMVLRENIQVAECRTEILTQRNIPTNGQLDDHLQIHYLQPCLGRDGYDSTDKLRNLGTREGTPRTLDLSTD
jgi:hypothetical protein